LKLRLSKPGDAFRDGLPLDDLPKTVQYYFHATLEELYPNFRTGALGVMQILYIGALIRRSNKVNQPDELKPFLMQSG
jgi:hypothetical protein